MILLTKYTQQCTNLASERVWHPVILRKTYQQYNAEWQGVAMRRHTEITVKYMRHHAHLPMTHVLCHTETLTTSRNIDNLYRFIE